MTNISKIAATALLLSTIVSATPAFAGDMERRVITKVIDGYGGSKFENMKSITLYSDLRFGWLNQGQTANFVELAPMKKIHQFDLKNERASEEAWGRAGAYNERVFSTKDGHTEIDYIEKTFTVDKEASFYDHFRGEIQGSDTLLAYELVKHKNTATYKSDKTYMGVNHHLIEFDMPGTSIKSLLWVNSESGHVSMMQRNIPGRYLLSYVFDDFRKTKGISYAEDFVMIEYTKSRSIEVNRVKPATFTIDRGINPAPETLDNSEMNLDEVTPALFQTGQGGAYSAFFDAGDHLISLGGYFGLKDRYEAYIQANGPKPLRYVIFTHHHADHMGGAKDAFELGATLVMPESARENATESVGPDIPANKLMMLTQDKTSLNGVDIYMTSTPHVQSYALLHVPAAKTIFQEDLYNAKFKTRGSAVDHNGMALKADIERLGLDVDYILGAHTRKIESFAEFPAQAEKYVPGKCPTRRKICR